MSHHHKIRIALLVLFCISLISYPIWQVMSASLPSATHPIMFGYYHVLAQYGDFSNDIKNYTNTEIILQNSFLREDGTNDLNGFNNAFNKSIAAGQNIIFAPTISPLNLLDRGLEAAKPFWDKIGLIYLADEPGWDKATTEANISSFKNTLSAKGLAQKEIAINYTNQQIMTGDSFQASNLDVVGFEAYVDPSQQNNSNLVANLDSQIDQAKAKIGNKKMFIVIQAYNRNGAWTNLNSLQSIQTSPYLKAYNDNNVVGLFLFSYARPGGTKDLGSCISTEHKRIWGAITGTAQPASVGCGIAATPTNEPAPAPSFDATTGWGGSLAYNSKNNNWLVVSSLSGTFGRIMGNDGKPVTDQLTLDPGSSGAPKSVYAPDINKYLVVWLNYDNNEMAGQFINPDGSFAGGRLSIYKINYPTEAFLFEAKSVLRYDSKNKKFVLAWTYVFNRNAGINLMTISQSGAPGPIVYVVPVINGPNGGGPSLAINERSNEYCVAYDRRSDNPGLIAVKKINATSLAVGPETGITVPVNTSLNANIVYNSVSGKYLLAWEDYTGGVGIKGRLLNGCNAGDGGSIIAIQKGGTSSLAYNPRSNSYGIIVQNGNDFGNTYTILNSALTKIAGGIAFTGSRSGKGGNFNPFIASNMNDGTFAATSAIDYNPTRFAPNLGPKVSAKNTPIGSLDGVTCKVIGGWAVDMNTPDQPITVQVFINGPQEVGARIFSGATSVLRDDVNSNLGITGNHGFSIPVPASVTDGKDHDVWLYAKDSKTGQNISFENNYKNFNSSTCGIIPTITPTPTYILEEPTGPPVITGFEPIQAITGEQVELFGTNLVESIQLELPNGTTYPVTASIGPSRTTASFIVPTGLSANSYRISMSGPKGSTTSAQQIGVVEGAPEFSSMPGTTPPTQGLPTDLGQLIQQIFAWSLGILGIAVFVMFFYSGFLWLTAAGNTAKIGEARSHMTNAVFGAILLLSSYLILYTINPDFVKNTVNLPGLGTTTPPSGGGTIPPPATGPSHDDIVKSWRSKYPTTMNASQIVEMLKGVAADVTKSGDPDGPFGIAQKPGSPCNNYSCDIICSGQGDQQRQWDVITDAGPEGTNNPVGWNFVPEIAIRICEISK